MRLEGITTHNLRIRELELPERALIVVTGPSGSGKSSLAFDTLAREGERRYLLALSRREAVRVPPPASVKGAEGLPPAVALPQRVPPKNPRLTVGTVTGILEILRGLLAEFGERPCPGCGHPVRPLSLAEALSLYDELPEGRRLVVRAPIFGPSPAVLSYLQGEGFSRFIINGTPVDLTEEAPPKEIQSLEAVVDRLIKKGAERLRYLEALRLAQGLSGGPVILEVLEGPLFRFTLGDYCPYCGRGLPPLSPGAFSYNHPAGACPSCQGLGEKEGEICSRCQGLRLRRESLEVRLSGSPLREILSTPLGKLRNFVRDLKLPAPEDLWGPFRRRLLRILEKLVFLELGHLHLFSPFHRLSTGERQRVELATLLSLEISGALFVLDEPGLGLSPLEKEKVLVLVRELILSGNTVVIVEHDPLFIRSAEMVVELGPGAGRKGGKLLFCGPPEELSRRADLPTGAFLSGGRILTRPRRRPRKFLSFSGVRLPQEALTVVCGPSGSGKTLFLRKIQEEAGYQDRDPLLVEGEISAPARALVATYLGIFDELRKLLSATPRARELGLRPAHFSPFSREGRCPTCGGRGERTFEIPGVLSTEVPCEGCQGTGLRPEALRITYRGLSVPEILDLTLTEALSVFSRVARMVEPLSRAEALGLGYLRLGQPLKALSGGEKLRLRLTRELLSGGGKELILLDLPTMGLHLGDLEGLLKVFEAMLSAGKTLVVADNHPLLVLLADHLLVLEKGRAVFEGPPQDYLESGHPLAERLLPYRALVK
ncbi:hypothetical protein FVE67_03800 [Thermosulfurimonas marina]|uniref:UvrABC system protein A n=1 Tax=Thermosulfurimonas marina TaxID=2047767 RepID=A0A6H1WS12_9BACT|nr:hypothetical protein [Thermosulfurimonas marina]QJA05972.1 hypothetical protein FVE67_03800 [Thermosulfurimonas marina]